MNTFDFLDNLVLPPFSINFNSIQILSWSLNSNNLLFNFVDQLEDIHLFDNLENITSIYHYSIPTVKLAYPEPYIASASLMHNDLWFIHILIYQYWLWFVFIFIIVFFFITFICTVRWCNLRIKPKRETRGVSRSKCGDLITAIVPVSWATSIIINESTDAIDYYDGFGTTELVVGIRAYQWGWEYYYPKDIDLNYNIKNNYSIFIGNSLKYNKSSNNVADVNNFWKFYQNKITDFVITPAHLIILSNDINKIIPLLHTNTIGTSSLSEYSAFRKVRSFSKNSPISHNSLLSFNNLYLNFHSLFHSSKLINDEGFLNVKKHHNYISPYSLSPYNTSFINSKNSEYWLKNTYHYNHLRTLLISTPSANVLNYFTNNFVNNLTLTKFNFNKILNFNNNSDKKSSPYLLYKLINVNFFKKNISLNNNYFFNENDKYFNFNFFNKIISAFSPSQSLLTPEKSLRKWTNLKHNSTQFNYSLNNQIANFFQKIINSNGTLYDDFNYFAKSNWINVSTINNLLNSKLNFESPYSPIPSNKYCYNLSDFDNPKFSQLDDVSLILQGKEDQIPFAFLSAYWNFYWNNASFDLRLHNLLKKSKMLNNFYAPFFHFYYDYDFRNWQNFELLEDFYWEHTFNLFHFDEYLTNKNKFYDFFNFENLNEAFLIKNKIMIFNKKPNQLGDYVFNWNPELIFFNNIFSDDTWSDLKLSHPNVSSLILNSYLLSSIDESFDAQKYFLINSNFLQNNFIKLSLNNFNLNSYINVFNTFRSDFDDSNWFKNEIFKDKNLNINNLLSPIIVLDLNYNLPFQFTNSNGFRFEDNFVLRSSIKNSIVTYNAIQKVFKSRFDEMRSHSNLNNFALSEVNQPYISSPKTPYETLLGKNKFNYFNVNLPKPTPIKNFNTYYSNFNYNNFYFFDFPFLTSLKSDASRFMWFDWFSKWSYVEIQPSSASKYTSNGMPFLNKVFDFTTSQNEILNETETYFNRITRSRKNSLSNYTFSPFFFLKNNKWNPYSLLNEYKTNWSDTLTYLFFNLDKSTWYWTVSSNFEQNNTFVSGFSSANTYAKSSWKNNNPTSSFYYNIATFSDILTKREYVYKIFLNNTNKLINLPVLFINSPNNSTLFDLKTLFNFVDPIMLSNEYSHSIYLSSLQYFNFLVKVSFFNTYKNSISDYIIPNLENFFFSNLDYNFKNSNDILLKNQYRPMRRGINNMIRLQATGAIAMPIEIRLQILASSKDVIHSWAIPSAGVKIDCVPGYSSHKVIIFLVSGIFWGQCMEVCGRYHHWMPIIVYFMKRDLFFLWCTHFVFSSGINSYWNINDRMNGDHVKFVSYDKNQWIDELMS